MSPNPMGPVWARLDDDPPVFHADRAAAEFPPGGWARVLGLGLLRELPPSNSAACHECGTGYANRVAFLPDAAGGSRPYLRCPSCGPVRVDPAALRRWAVDARAVGAAVLGLAGGTGVPAEVVPGLLWHLGRARWAGRARDAYLARGVYAETRPAVAAALAGRPAAVVFVPTEAAAARWADTSNAVVALDAAVALGPGGLAFDPSAVEARLPAPPAERRPARPPRKRAGPATTIERLEAEMIAFLRGARAHAEITADARGTPELLPRPTMKYLAGAVGVSQASVTRVFRDPAARVLRLYWEVATDIDQVLRFGGPVGR